MSNGNGKTKKNGNRTTASDPTNIGNILVSMGHIDKDTLLILVEEFLQSKDEMLGEFLIKRSAVTRDNVELALIRQKLLREDFSNDSIKEVMRITRAVDDRVLSNINDVVDASNLVMEKTNGKY